MRLVILLLAGALMGLSGCADRSGDAADLPPETDGEGGIEANETYGANERRFSPFGERNGPYVWQAETENEPVFDADTADRLARLAESVQGVNGATCVVLGKVAIVGIDVDGNLDRGQVGSLKYAVAEALAKDPAGVRALVTADLDIGSRIKGIRDSIGEGRPIRGLAEQFAELVGRMMPQLPRDTAPKAEPQGHPDDRQNLMQQQGGRQQAPQSQQQSQPSQRQNRQQDQPSKQAQDQNRQ